MTLEEKQLLLIDLCARLPYGVRVNYGGYEGCDYKLTLMTLQDFPTEDLKPYLRSMSSMTKEEEDELCKLCTLSDCNVNEEWEFCGIQIISSHPRYGTYFSTDYSVIDWLNKKMFDYRGLIGEGLAIEVTEENNPYKD